MKLTLCVCNDNQHFAFRITLDCRRDCTVHWCVPYVCVLYCSRRRHDFYSSGQVSSIQFRYRQTELMTNVAAQRMRMFIFIAIYSALKINNYICYLSELCMSDSSRNSWVHELSIVIRDVKEQANSIWSRQQSECSTESDGATPEECRDRQQSGFVTEPFKLIIFRVFSFSPFAVSLLHSLFRCVCCRRSDWLCVCVCSKLFGRCIPFARIKHFYNQPNLIRWLQWLRWHRNKLNRQRLLLPWCLIVVIFVCVWRCHSNWTVSHRNCSHFSIVACQNFNTIFSPEFQSKTAKRTE